MRMVTSNREDSCARWFPTVIMKRISLFSNWRDTDVCVLSIPLLPRYIRFHDGRNDDVGDVVGIGGIDIHPSSLSQQIRIASS